MYKILCRSSVTTKSRDRIGYADGVSNRRDLAGADMLCPTSKIDVVFNLVDIYIYIYIA
jgi:hypothetical protein